ncbi:MAG: hypothetical protein QW103_01215 [Candidatus Pacearchaeota archaeon]
MDNRLTEKQKKEIEEQSKKLLVEFNRKLEKLKFDAKNFFVEKKKGRKEKKEYKYSDIFRNIFLKNAPEKNNNSIIAEKGIWK